MLTSEDLRVGIELIEKAAFTGKDARGAADMLDRYRAELKAMTAPKRPEVVPSNGHGEHVNQ